MDEEVQDAIKSKECVERRYQWALTTVLGMLCLTLGMLIQNERLSRTVYESQTRITTLEQRFDKIEVKLDKILVTVQKEN